jgi:hypothetical protein
MPAASIILEKDAKSVGSHHHHRSSSSSSSSSWIVTNEGVAVAR